MYLIFGTTSKRKVEDLQNIINEMNLDIEVVSLKDIGWDRDEIDENGLTIEQVAVYTDPKFNYDQMRQIRLGFWTSLTMCLTMEQVAIYADPKFDSSQMCEIRMGLENHLSMEQVALYAKPYYKWEQMDAIRLELEKGLTNR